MKLNLKIPLLLLALTLLTIAPATAFGSDKNQPAELSTITTEEALYNLANKLTEMLLSLRNVIAVNQDVINTSSVSGEYCFKGLVPAVVGTQVGYDFYIRTGIRVKQTSLTLRNLTNAPDEWERNALERFGAPDYPKETPIAETVTAGGNGVYRFIKPVYISNACLQCHGEKEQIRRDIREYLEFHYPNDKATGYKEGALRGGISITIPITKPALDK
ncbi:MAG: hypothetical protein A2060_01575 [Planctomycetes bacterium GWA2_50_13]|nr:MAG: hypothetical protein A2060_01575 [Planctomycetes bacterium GWA2_50_13]OHB96635.1 MAG: hypothetical protein A3I59_00725 [Planctomycetes bacterium RIFCSPLOWO2_02_FULL_50_16]OHC03924.1 MAG: hypothetical protein A3G17_05050 [Planctomycetes bacterium RIFCSPLOWO2_12_FULL_50_35]HCN18738.1 hypothetical protein [Planctomycetia bacterium]